MINKIEKLASVIIVLILALLWILSGQFLSDFRSLFNEAQIDMPILTKAILASHKYWILIVLTACIGTVQVWKNKKRNGWMLLSIPIVLALILLPIIVFTMYLPIFELAEMK